ncbi:MAG TPA: lamin tail domain-containing protein [bacterium]
MTLLLTGQIAWSQAVLSEIMFNPLESQDHYEEFIELFNASSSDWLDLSGYLIGDQDEQDSLLELGQGFLLAPQCYALILDPGYWDHSDVYDTLMDPEALLLTINDGSFGAFGLRNDPPDTVVLVAPGGQTIAAYGYTSGNTSGHSEEKIRLEYGDEPGNWANSLTRLGTPGFVNSVQPLNLDIAIIRLQAAPSPLPSGEQVTLTAVLSNLGMQAATGGEVIFTIGPFNFSAPDSILGAADFAGLTPADSAIASLSLDSLPSGPHRITAYHSLTDLDSTNDSLSLLLPTGYPAATIILNEIMAAPAENSSEWIEIYNRSAANVDLLFWTFSDEDTSQRRMIADSSLVMVSGGYALLSQDSNIFDWEIPPEIPVLVLNEPWPSLNNDGDTPTLFDAAGAVQDAVPYAGWEIPSAISLERIYPDAASDDPANWQPSQVENGGTPGQVNSYQPPPGPLPPSGSLAYSPDPFDPDRHGALQIQISLPTNAISAAVIAFDLRGRRLKVIFDGSVPTGYQEILWDGRDNENRRIPPGLYIMFAEFRDAGGSRKSISKKTLVIAGKL